MRTHARPHPPSMLRISGTLSRKGRGKKKVITLREILSQSCPSSVSPPETSTLPGESSTFSFFTTPSSTSME